MLVHLLAHKTYSLTFFRLLNQLGDIILKNEFPKVRCIRQSIKYPLVSNLRAEIRKQMEEFGVRGKISAGDSVALTGSSRGINHQDRILKEVVQYIQKLDAHPFIIPAMGSHGGATTKGQLHILKEYGITEKTMGCPIKASMEVVKIGECELGSPVYVDKYAFSADKVILINKIKTHSKFVGRIESGLCKMCLMGLGKHKGAKQYHKMVATHSWPEVLESVSEVVLKTLPIVCGIGLIQNSQKKIAEIHILAPEELPRKEPQLLERYKGLIGKIPFKNIDLLIVDEMGKNIFGTGMDTNITGRKSSSPMNVQWLFVRDLTKETHGNAQGIGLADFTTHRLVNKIDFSQTYLNALTAYRTDSPKIPINLPNDKEVLKNVFNLAHLEDNSQFRLVWIKNTLELSKFIISEAFFKEVRTRDDLRFIGESVPLKFNSEGFLENSKQYW